MAIKKIRKDDVVIVLTGKDKKRTGKVLKHIGKDRILVEGINIVKKTVKPNPQKNTQGGIMEKEMGIHVSNVAILNPVTKKPDRVGVKVTVENGVKKRTRFFKSNGELIEI